LAEDIGSDPELRLIGVDLRERIPGYGIPVKVIQYAFYKREKALKRLFEQEKEERKKQEEEDGNGARKRKRDEKEEDDDDRKRKQSAGDSGKRDDYSGSRNEA
jgi:hypothetical protein